MPTLQIELADDIYRTLDRLARENETDPATLLRAQIERLVATYQGAGLTPGLREHLAASIDEHRPLLQRLAE
jgi:predicted transcriptional regulator